MTPQANYTHDESLVDLNSWQLLSPVESSVGSGLGISHCYPGHAFVYSFECYAGTELGRSWCFHTEASFCRLLAYAIAVRWDDCLEYQ
jgi:hypothetical protein